MRDYRIETTQFKFLTILSLTIEKEINQHACAIVSGLIDDTCVTEYQNTLMQDTWVQVSAVDRDGQSKTLINGIVAGFTLDSAVHQKILTLKIMSGSWLMDCEVHFRTFQNAALSYGDVMKVINQRYTDSDFIGVDAVNAPIGGFILQYQETDWEFLRRISSYFGSCVTPSSAHVGAKYYVGKHNKEVYKVPSGTPYIASKQVGKFMQMSASGFGSMVERDYLEWQFQSRDMLDLWDQITLDLYISYVCKIHSEYTGSELVHTYSFRNEGGIASIPAFNPNVSGCSFGATVKEVKQDVVRIDVINDENSRQNDTIWFPYSTVYSTPSGPGWYCMPEIGDQVRLHVPCAQDSTAYVISAVHKGNSSDRQNPDHKSIKTVHGKELLMTPDLIKLTNNKGMSIEIDDGAGIRISSDKEILIKAASTVTISSDNESLAISGTEAVDMRQGGASIHLDDDIAFTGAKFRIQ